MAKDEQDDFHASPETMARLRARSEARVKEKDEKRRRAWEGEKGVKKLSTHLRALSSPLPADEQAALMYSPHGQLHRLPHLAELAENRLKEIREGDYLIGRPKHDLEDWRYEAVGLAQHYISVLENVMRTDQESFLQAVASGENRRLDNLIGSLLDDAIAQLEALRKASIENPSDQAMN